MSSSTLPRPTQAQDAQERQALILAYLDSVNGLLHTYAASARLEYDDLRQEAAITIMHCLEVKPGEASRLHSYIHTSVRHRIIDKIRQAKRHQTASLDAPIIQGEEGGATLADLLPSGYSVEPLTILLAREELGAFSTWLEGGTARAMLRQRERSRYRELTDTALASLIVQEATR